MALQASYRQGWKTHSHSNPHLSNFWIGRRNRNRIILLLSLAGSPARKVSYRESRLSGLGRPNFAFPARACSGGKFFASSVGEARSISPWSGFLTRWTWPKFHSVEYLVLLCTRLARSASADHAIRA